MLLIEDIEITEFRGIRKLKLSLDKKSFGICGPNGTGKSGVVDAIEFCLSGDITRLSGQGTGDLSVKQHAPHVDWKKAPEKATVTLTACLLTNDKQFKIERSVSNPRQVKITPPDVHLTAVVKEIEQHPEFALSRREIAKYIIAPAGERSRDVQALLRLDEVEQIRKAFTRIANDRKRDHTSAINARETARANLLQPLGLSVFDPAKILEKVNERRALLKLSPLEKLTTTTALNEGVVGVVSATKKRVIVKITALLDLNAFMTAFARGDDPTLAIERLALRQSLQDVLANTKAFKAIRQQTLIQSGLELIDSDACPLCDTNWDADDLRDYLTQKLENASETKKTIVSLQDRIDKLIIPLRAKLGQIERIVGYCAALDAPIDSSELTKASVKIQDIIETLSNPFTDIENLTKAIETLAPDFSTSIVESSKCVSLCQAAVAALPDISKEDQARDELLLAQERYEKALAAGSLVTTTLAKKKTADAVLNEFNNSVTEVLNAIYDEVAEDFSSYYRAINGDDELEFSGNLIAGEGGLNLGADFFGRGHFPPGAYHSEGHQDGMGLCLYLALMKHTLGDKFSFAVLDDVLMSVDSSHRRDVCRLLIKQFPRTQFILTTHDRVWLQYMYTEKLIHSSSTFGGWTVDHGPRVWDDHDVWVEIESELAKSNVPTASHHLRRYLEHICAQLADAFRAPVDFRGDGQYELEDLMQPAINRWLKKLVDAEKAAKSWQNAEGIELAAKLIAATKAARDKANVERWAINKTVHYNEWVNLTASEFRIVVAAFKDLLEAMQCPSCKTLVYLSPRRSAEVIRCRCNKLTMNLLTK